MKAESLLRSAGLLGDLHYKPDIFTHLGIYRNNIWGFRPSIYMSKMSRQERKSKITLTGTGGNRTVLTSIIHSSCFYLQGSATWTVARDWRFLILEFWPRFVQQAFWKLLITSLSFRSLLTYRPRSQTSSLTTTPSSITRRRSRRRRIENEKLKIYVDWSDHITVSLLSSVK